jgi:hypothetical protein
VFHLSNEVCKRKQKQKQNPTSFNLSRGIQRAQAAGKNSECGVIQQRIPDTESALSSGFILTPID